MYKKIMLALTFTMILSLSLTAADPQTTISLRPEIAQVKKSIDVAVKEIIIDADNPNKTTYRVGDNLTVCCRASYEGPVPEEGWRMVIWMNGKEVIHSDGPHVNPILDGQPDYHGICGEYKITSTGEHQLQCMLDSKNQLTETNEKNNRWIRIFNVLPQLILPARVSTATAIRTSLKIKKPDISMEEVKVTPDTGTELKAGEKAWVSCKWKRVGPEPANSFRVGSYYDGNPVGLPQGSVMDKTSTSSTLSTPWIAVAGMHTVKCIADTQNTVDEFNEGNNEMSIKIRVKTGDPTDLIAVKTVVDPDSGDKLFAGRKAWARCTWKRIGMQPHPFRVGTYIDGKPVGLAMGSVVDNTTMGTTLSTPWTALAGKHVILCKVDTEGTVTETNETNNEIKAKFEVIPILITPVPLEIK